MLKKLMVNLALCMLVLMSTQYTVVEGDTLSKVALKFYEPNNNNLRQFLEFQEGIVQLNYDIIGNGQLKPGDVLTINEWMEVENGESK